MWASFVGSVSDMNTAVWADAQDVPSSLNLRLGKIQVDQPGLGPCLEFGEGAV